MNRIVSALGIVLVGCGGNGKPDVEPTWDWARVSCRSGTHQVGTACVDDAFNDVVFPPAASVATVDTAGDGSGYVRGVLFVRVRDASMTLADATLLVESHGGQVIGAVPFAGLYHASFADAVTEDALVAKAATLASEARVEFVLRDEATAGAAAPSRPKTTDFEKLLPTTLYEDVYGRLPDEAIGSTGKWPFEKIRMTQAWDAIYEANPKLSKVVVGIIDGRVEQRIFPGLTFAGSVDLRYSDYEAYKSSLVSHGTAVASIIGAPNDNTASTGILGPMSCIEYDLAAMAVLSEHRRCSGSGEYQCAGVNVGGGAGACVQTAQDVAQVCYATCTPDAGACPVGQECQVVDVIGYKLGLCTVRIDRGVLTDNAILFGTIHAIQAGARVVNMSVGGWYASDDDNETRRVRHAALMRQIAAKAPGTLFVAAAGNAGLDAAREWPCSTARQDEVATILDAGTLPGSVPNFLCIGATDEHDARAFWYDPPNDRDAGTGVGSSNYDVNADADGGTPTIALAAPGDRELAELPSGKLTMFRGTSGAAPLVSGAAGLLFAILPGMDGEVAKRILLTQADPIRDQSLGGKRLNVEDAVKKAIQISETLHPSDKGQGECREKDKRPEPEGGENICPIGAPLCVWKLNPQTGSSLWVGELLAAWKTEELLSQLEISVDKASTGERIRFGVTFHSGIYPSLPLTATHNSVEGAGTCSPDDCQGAYGMVWFSDGTWEYITTVTVSLRFAKASVTGTLDITAEDGRSMSMEVKGTEETAR